MSNDTARTFVLRMRAEGRSDDDIREAFRSSGWADADIDALFASLTSAPKPPSDASTSGTPAPTPTWVSDLGWCWGACGLTWIWGIANNVWITLLALLALIPVLGWLFFIGFAVWLGMNGHALAWQHRRFASTDDFRATMRAWNNGGAIFLIVVLVFGVIGPIPAAILFPVFARSREKAREVSCQSNLKQIGLAAMMYVQDYNQHFPVSSGARTVLYPYLKNDQIWQCASNPSGSYAMSPTLSGAVLASIARPAETILFYEVDGLGQPVFPHNNGASVCYADGHVRWLRQSDLQPLLSQLGSATPQPPPPTQTLPASPPAPTPPAGPQDLLKTFGQARDKARAASCESNLKQLALAEMMYVQDYDSHFPRAGEYHKLIFPYVKNEMVFQCPVGGTYAMNSKLSGLELKTIAEPSRTILLFDVDASGRPAYRHDGEIALAFADAHVKLCTPEEAKAFTW